nr:hypothetical protein [Tanacetum cinerariifolium]
MLLFRRSRWLKGFSSSLISNGYFFISRNSLKYFSVSSSNPCEASKPLNYNIMVDFLISSLGFTKEAAITTSSKIRGLSSDQIVRLITNEPWVLTLDRLAFERKLAWVVEELGIHEHSKMFVYGICLVTRLKESTIEKKLKILRDYGWSEEEIAIFVRSNPVNLCYSEAKMRQWLDFFMKELVNLLDLLCSSVEL